MSIFDIFNQWRKQELSTHTTKPKKRKKKAGGNEADPEKAKIIRKLKHHTKYLKLEHEDVKELFVKAKTEFFMKIEEFCREYPEARNPLIPAEKQKKGSKQEEEHHEDLKTIYREIIRATHPDTHPGDEELADICISANQAKTNNKIDELIDISFDLDIDISNISIELIEEIEESLRLKEKKIQEMRQDTSMMWYHATPQQQEDLIKKLCPIEKKEEEE